MPQDEGCEKSLGRDSVEINAIAAVAGVVVAYAVVVVVLAAVVVDTAAAD